MRIAFVDTTVEKPPTGGCQTFLYDLATSLYSAGYEVHVVYQAGRDPSVTKRLFSKGVLTHHDLWTRWCLPEERAARVASWVHAQSIDVFVVSVSQDVGWLTLPLLDQKVTTIAIVHTDGPSFYKPLSHYGVLVDRAVGVSATICQRIVADCGIPAERVRRIPYGIIPAPISDVEHRWISSNPGPHVLRIGYVGRLDQIQKRIRDLPALLSELTRRRLSFHMDVLGDGQESKWLKQQILSAGLSHTVSFRGWQTPQQIRSHLLGLDALLLFSSFEGLPLALLESMSHAVVPVVTRISSGNAEIVNEGYNGYLVPVGDICAFADCLEILANSPRTLRRLSKSAWYSSHRYSMQRMVDNYINVFTVGSSTRTEIRALRPKIDYPLMLSCQSPYPRWIRRLKWGVFGTITLASGRIMASARVIVHALGALRGSLWRQ